MFHLTRNLLIYTVITSSVYRCPTTNEMRKRWLRLLKNKCTMLDWYKSQICSKHFEPKFFDSQRRLKENAVPTIFAPTLPKLAVGKSVKVIHLYFTYYPNIPNFPSFSSVSIYCDTVCLCTDLPSAFSFCNNCHEINFYAYNIYIFLYLRSIITLLCLATE